MATFEKIRNTGILAGLLLVLSGFVLCIGFLGSNMDFWQQTGFIAGYFIGAYIGLKLINRVYHMGYKQGLQHKKKMKHEED